MLETTKPKYEKYSRSERFNPGGNSARLPASETASCRPPPELEAAFRELAAMRFLDYELIRTEKAKSLGIRVGFLDEEVAKYRPPKEDTGNAGRGLSLPVPEPWPDPVMAPK
jgi:hypothetical protein